MFNRGRRLFPFSLYTCVHTPGIQFQGNSSPTFDILRETNKWRLSSKTRNLSTRDIMLSSLIAKAPFPDVRRISVNPPPPPPLFLLDLHEDNFSVWFERGKQSWLFGGMSCCSRENLSRITKA